MEKLIKAIKAHADAMGITPQSFLRRTINANWQLWEKWAAGKASPTVMQADRIYAAIKAERRGAK